MKNKWCVVLYSLFSPFPALDEKKGTSEEEGRLDGACCTEEILALDVIFVGQISYGFLQAT